MSYQLNYVFDPLVKVIDRCFKELNKNIISNQIENEKIKENQKKMYIDSEIKNYNQNNSQYLTPILYNNNNNNNNNNIHYSSWTNDSSRIHNNSNFS